LLAEPRSVAIQSAMLTVSRPQSQPHLLRAVCALVSLIASDPAQSVLALHQWLPTISISLSITWQGTGTSRYIVLELLAAKTPRQATKRTPQGCSGGSKDQRVAAMFRALCCKPVVSQGPIGITNTVTACCSQDSRSWEICRRTKG